MPASATSTEVEGNWPQRFIQCGGDAVTYRIDVWPRSIDGQPLCAVAFVPLAGVKGSPIPVTGPAEVRQMVGDEERYEIQMAPGWAGILIVGIQSADRLNVGDSLFRLHLKSDDRLVRYQRAVQAFLDSRRDERWELYVVHRA